jgi:hypothetical protein
MLRFKYLVALLAVYVGAILVAPPPAHAHFLWLKTIRGENDQTQAFLYFGETATDEAYHLPEKLAKTEIWRRAIDGERAKLESKPLETQDRIGLVAPLPDNSLCVLEASQQYGIYGRSLLIYYAKHVHVDSNDKLHAAASSKDLKLEIVAKPTEAGYDMTVLWEGKPLPGAKLTVAVGGEEAVEKTTDDEGRVPVKNDGGGLVSALANFTDEKRSGELDGKPYVGVMHYSSLTIGEPAANAADEGSDEEKVSAAKPPLPPLPEAVSSFGAVVVDGWLYVYSGHTGEEHEHSAANLSKHFRRIKLEGGTEWAELPIEKPLQGLPLVTHSGKIYRVGGLDARNPTTDEDEDLHSTAEFAEFDPATRKWRTLAPLPAPRSSHNAVVIGDHLYVVGGWRLYGKSPGDWQADALAYDFAKPHKGWQKLAAPKFKRRALALAEWQGKLVAIGGMNEKGKTSRRVDIFDPAADSWSRGPDLPGAGMAGFGCSACTLDSQLYASGLRGIVYRLTNTGSAWEEAARLDRPRFFHQLLPAGDGDLLAVAGASHSGHLADIELVEVSREQPDQRETAQLPSARSADAL